MNKGAKKAKMNNSDPQIEYVPVDGRYELIHDSRQWNPAHHEAFRNPRQVLSLLRGYKHQHGENLDVNAAGPGGFTPLMLVVMKRHGSHDGFIPPIESSVTALLKANVDPNATNDFGQTALHLAAVSSRADYVEQLLEAGANPNIGDNWGQSPLEVAIGAGAEGPFMVRHAWLCIHKLIHA